jgi:hypothetical protein
MTNELVFQNYDSINEMDLVTIEGGKINWKKVWGAAAIAVGTSLIGGGVATAIEYNIPLGVAFVAGGFALTAEGYKTINETL